MKHAILMTVYKDVNLVNRLIKSYPESFDIYIHIDKKSYIKPSDIHRDNGKVQTIKKYKINWGGYNHVLAFFELLKEAYNKGKYDYFHLVTGQDMFVGSQNQLDAYILSKVKDSCFVENNTIPCKKYSFWDYGYGIIDYFIPSDLIDFNQKTKKGIYLYRFFKLVERRLHLTRKRPSETYYMGSVYCSLSHKAVNYILNDPMSFKILRRLKHTLCGEGIFFPTVAMYSGCPVTGKNLTYVDWSDPIEHPKILDETDYGKWGEEKFFIRKIDKQKSWKLIELIQRNNNLQE